MKTNRILALALFGLSTLNHLPAIAFIRVGLVAIALAAAGQLSTLFAQGTAFTYQGRLLHNGAPANGPYDCIFRPYDVPTGGSALTFANLRRITASNGLFTTTLDFGPAVFTGGARWLEIEIGTNGVDTLLAPRQPLTPAPYAIFAASAANVMNGALQPEDLNLGSFGTTFWKVGGNAGTSTDFIGTTDDQPFDVRVNNVRVMRYRLVTDPDGFYGQAPNVIGGSRVNFASANVVGATISGGGEVGPLGLEHPNRVTAHFGTVGGGEDNISSGEYTTVGGGKENTASGYVATVSGGTYNTASGYGATVSGGYFNTASGVEATVAGGSFNEAGGNYSFAAGDNARAVHDGSFVWADHSAEDFSSTTTNQFRVRSTGGAAFVTATDSSGAATAGVRVQSGGTSWTSISDRNVKKNFQPVDAVAVLNKLTSIPLTQWNYKWESETNTPHLGPMAQDFKAAFYPGRDDKSISTLEFDGVALAAIQGLNEKLEVRSEKAEVRTRELEQQVKEKDGRISALENRLAQLEKVLATLAVEAVAR